MIYNIPELTTRLKTTPFTSGLVSTTNPNPSLSSYIGHFLQLCIPQHIIKDDKPFLSASYNEENLHYLYGFEKSNQKHVAFAKDSVAFELMRYRRPGKLTTFIREGDIKTYINYFKTTNNNLLPLLNFFSIYDESSFKLINTATSLLSNQRCSIILTNKTLATKITESNRYYIKASIQIKNAILTASNSTVYTTLSELPSKALEPSKISSLLPSGYNLDSLYILVLGYGPSNITKTLDPISISNYNTWVDAAKEVRLILDRTISLHYAAAHTQALEAKITAKETLVPQLNLYPTPPKFSIESDITLNRKLKLSQGKGLTPLLMQLDNTQIREFNATQGRITGIIDALLSKPNLLSKDIKETKERLLNLGYNLKLSPSLEKVISNKSKFYKKEAQPLNPVTNTELLAYFKPGLYKCKSDVTNPETLKPIWKKDKEYSITPSWSREVFDAGDEPVVNELGSIIGSDIYKINLSVLELVVETEGKTVFIKENKTRETDEYEKWEPLLDEFLSAFDLPNVPDVSITRSDDINRLKDKLIKRLPHLKPYQVEETVKNSLKNGGILASVMGSGKTHMGIGVLYLRNKAFNLIIVPPSLVSNWSKTLREYNFYARKLLTHESVDRLISHYNNIKGLPPKEKRAAMYADQEFYITTPEFLSLGDTGNMVFDEWDATYIKRGKTLTDTKERLILYETCTVKSTRHSSMNEAKELNISLNQSHEFSSHVKECPKCKANKESGFTAKGYCNNCGYSFSQYLGTKYNLHTLKNGKKITGRDFIFNNVNSTIKETEELKQSLPSQLNIAKIHQRICLPGKNGAPVKSSTTEQELVTKPKTHSNYSIPAYKRLRKIFGSKLIDEVHEVANFDSLRGAAVKAIKCDETWACSGTLSRGHVKDIESALLHAYEANTPICPYTEWDRKAFRDQFLTQKIKKTVYHDDVKEIYKGSKTSITIVPEASNVTLLRKVLASKMTMVSPSIVEAEWSLPSITRTYAPVTLSPDNYKYYLEVLNNIASWYKHASSKDIRRNTMSKLWELRHICENDDKLKVIEQYIKAWYEQGDKFVIVSPTKPLYDKIVASLKELKIKHICVDERTPASKREEVTLKFEDPSIRALVSRTKLVNTGLNTLVHANKLIIAGLEYFPSVLRQMERRLVRPGQKASNVEIVYPIVRTSPRESIEEQMLRLIFRKEAAVNEILEGKVRWVKSAQLIESIMEKQGAGKVLQAILQDEDSPISDIDLELLFNPLTLDPSLTNAIESIESDSPISDIELAILEDELNSTDILTKTSILPISNFTLELSSE